MNVLDPIGEFYDLYLDKEASPRIVEINDDGLGFNSDLENRPANPYLEL